MKNENRRRTNGKSVLDLIIEGIAPKDYTCDICGVETFGSNFCADCFKTVRLNNEQTCPVCGRKTFRPELCMQCKSKPPLYKKAVSAFVYEDGVVALIAKFKNGKQHLKEYFSDKIAERLHGFPPLDCIVYVPLSKKSLYKRGYNQGRLLAKALSKRIGTPTAYGAIKRVKVGRVQKGLTGAERAENVKGAFKIKKREEIKGRRVLLVDDVMTTGSTVDELCRILLKAGALAVYVATVASVEYKTPENRQDGSAKKQILN